MPWASAATIFASLELAARDLARLPVRGVGDYRRAPS